MSPESTRRLLAVHRVCGLFVSVNVLLFALTGMVLIFHEEIDAALDVSSSTSGAQTSITFSRAIEIARAGQPDARPLYVAEDDARPSIVYVGISKGSAKFADSKPIAVDRYRAKVASLDVENTFTAIVLKLHAQLLLGPPGALLVGVIGLAFLTSLLSGAVLYGPLMRRFAFGMLRRERQLRTLLADVHKLIGVATFGWQLAVVVTGVFLSLGSTLLQLYASTELAALAAPFAHESAVRDLSTIDEAVEQAERKSGGRRLSFVALPGSELASPRHYAVLLEGTSGLDQRMLTLGLVDARDPTSVDHRLLPWYLRALLVCEPLHFGDYGGLALKLTWLAFTLISAALAVSGVWITLSSRKRRAPNTLAGASTKLEVSP